MKRPIEINDNSTHIRYPNEIKVTENKAPTDESVRLYKEFDEKARQELVKTYKLGDNIFEALGHWFVRDGMGESVIYHIRFRLNGREIKVESFIPDNVLYELNLNSDYEREVYLKKIFITVLSKAIAEYFTQEFIKDMR